MKSSLSFRSSDLQLKTFIFLILGAVASGTVNAQAPLPTLKMTTREASMLLVKPGEAFSHFFSIRNTQTTNRRYQIQALQSLGWETLDCPDSIEIPAGAVSIVSVVTAVPSKEVAAARNETKLSINEVGGENVLIESAWAEVVGTGRAEANGIYRNEDENSSASSANSSFDIDTLAGSFWIELVNHSNSTLATRLELINSGAALAHLGRDPQVLIHPFERLMIPVVIQFTAEKSSSVFQLKVPIGGGDYISDPYVLRYLDPSRGGLPGSGDQEHRLRGGIQISSRAIIVDQRKEFEQRYRAQLQGPVSDYFYASFVLQGMMTPRGSSDSSPGMVDTLYLHLLGSRSELEFGWPIDPRLFGVPTDGQALRGVKAQYFLDQVDLGVAVGQEVDQGTVGATAGAQLRIEDNQKLALVLAHSGALDKNQVGLMYTGDHAINPNLTYGPTVSLVLGPIDDYRLWHRSLLRFKHQPRLPVVVFVENRMDPRQEIHRAGIRISRLGDVWNSSLSVGAGLARSLTGNESVFETDITAYVGRPILKNKVRAGLEFQFTRMSGEAYALNEISLGPRISTKISDHISLWAGAYGIFRNESDADSGSSSMPGYRLETGAEYLNGNHSVLFYARRRAYEEMTSSRSGGFKSEDSIELHYRRRFGIKYPGYFGLFTRFSRRESWGNSEELFDVGGEVSVKTGRVTWSLYGTTRPEVGVMLNIPLDFPSDKISPLFGGTRDSVLLGRVLHDGIPLEGVRAKLTMEGSGGKILVSSPSDSDGLLRFHKIPAGKYQMDLVVGSYPAALVLSEKIPPLDFPQKNRQRIELGLSATRSFGVIVFHDQNINGKYDEGERLESGVRAQIFQSETSSVYAEATTDQYGRARFSQLPLADLFLSIVKESLPAGARIDGDWPRKISAQQSLLNLPYQMDSGPPPVESFASVFVDFSTQVVESLASRFEISIQSAHSQRLNVEVSFNEELKKLIVEPLSTQSLLLRTEGLKIGSNEILVTLSSPGRDPELRRFRVIRLK